MCKESRRKEKTKMRKVLDERTQKKKRMSEKKWGIDACSWYHDTIRELGSLKFGGSDNTKRKKKLCIKIMNKSTVGGYIYTFKEKCKNKRSSN